MSVPSVQSVSSSSSSRSSGSPVKPVTKGSALGAMRKKAIQKIDCLIDMNTACPVIAAVCIAATIAFMVLAFLGYIDTLAVFYPIGGCVASFIVMRINQCCQERIASRHNQSLRGPHTAKYTIDLPKHFNARHPLPNKEEDA